MKSSLRPSSNRSPTRWGPRLSTSSGPQNAKTIWKYPRLEEMKVIVDSPLGALSKSSEFGDRGGFPVCFLHGSCGAYGPNTLYDGIVTRGEIFVDALRMTRECGEKVAATSLRVAFLGYVVLIFGGLFGGGTPPYRLPITLRLVVLFTGLLAIALGLVALSGKKEFRANLASWFLGTRSQKSFGQAIAGIVMGTIMVFMTLWSILATDRPLGTRPSQYVSPPAKLMVGRTA